MPPFQTAPCSGISFSEQIHTMSICWSQAEREEAGAGGNAASVSTLNTLSLVSPWERPWEKWRRSGGLCRVSPDSDAASVGSSCLLPEASQHHGKQCEWGSMAPFVLPSPLPLEGAARARQDWARTEKGGLWREKIIWHNHFVPVAKLELQKSSQSLGLSSLPCVEENYS